MTLQELLNSLLRARPHGWSVVWSGESLSVRPPDRAVCKFSIYFLGDGRLAIGRFDYSLNHWTGHRYVEPGLVSPEAVFEHMRQRINGANEPYQERCTPVPRQGADAAGAVPPTESNEQG